MRSRVPFRHPYRGETGSFQYGVTTASGKRRGDGDGRAHERQKPSRVTPRPSRALLRLALAVVVPLVATVVGAWVGLVPAATAHPELLASDPDNLTVVARPPKLIRLTYFDAVEPQRATVTLSVDGSPARELHSRIRGSEVLATVGSVPAGTNQQWVVAYEVIAYDGHTVADALSFVVAPDPDAPATPIPVGSAASAFDQPRLARDPVKGGPSGRDGSRPDVLSLLWVPAALVGLAIVGPAVVSARNRKRYRGDEPVSNRERSPDPS